ncbi:mevalonate kinase [Nasonia vitripennis]|uniref:Mevalonate kinase n=1 Tax=Nasonia vitripennis TaxID=7425 RepID=A0A7M7ILC6_NASVI|nr:mevalonate kinase [Nasonia vitripennis]XP_031787961.1 mevalonate kinase [Nasonia vitripennis]
MASFRISAPGKVILFGEHSVVYGKTAVAASLGLRSSLHFTELPHEECIIHIKMPKLGISKILSLHQVEEDFHRLDFYSGIAMNHDAINQKLQKYVATLGFENPDQRLSMECFFYAMMQVIRSDQLRLSSFILELDSELSIGAGAGSSASFTVCLVACFLHWSQLQKGTNLPNEFDSPTLNKISHYALNCEKIMHGKPSGIDNSVCTFGSVIEFRKPEPPKFITLGSKSLRVLLVDTKVARSTKLLVEKFGALSSSFPTIFKDMLQVYDELAMQALDIIKKIHATPENDQDRLLKHYDELSLLVDINQGLLATCQVSHETLDTICKTAKKYGFSAKLTGAGGGGFAYVLIPPNVNNAKVEDLTNELKIQGFSVTETKLGGSGVEVNDMD